MKKLILKNPLKNDEFCSLLFLRKCVNLHGNFVKVTQKGSVKLRIKKKNSGSKISGQFFLFRYLFLRNYVNLRKVSVKFP